MTEQLLHLRPGKSTMVDMESNKVLSLTPYEAALLAAVVDGTGEVKKERLIYLHRDNTPEPTVRAETLNLQTDETQPISPEDAKRIAVIVRETEAIEASDEPEIDKWARRSSKDPCIMGKPLNRNLI